MRAPSTAWKETIAPDEATRFESYAQMMRGLQKQNSAKLGNGRALHRKGLLGMEASLEVLDGLPEYARQGLFATPGKHEALIRLSNGSQGVQRDKTADIRGFSIKVLGVSGEGALGGPAPSQDFNLINMEVFSFPDAAQFVAFVEAAVKGPIGIIGHFIKTDGFFGGLKRVRALTQSVGRPFSGFASERFYSAAPIANGPYAAKVRLVPKRQGLPGQKDDFAKDFQDQLKSGPVEFELQLQFFVDDAVTPIERPNVLWPESEAPFVTVARLTIPPQPFEGPQATERTAKIEQAKFDPWNALIQHRPLGDVMRARKPSYYASQQERGA